MDEFLNQILMLLIIMVLKILTDLLKKKASYTFLIKFALEDIDCKHILVTSL